MNELEVNGQKVDLTNDVIAISRQVLDASNPGFRLIDITNRFSLPLTQNNKEIFGFPFTINSDNVDLDKTYPAKVIDQNPIFSGTGFINSYNKDVFNFQLADSSKDLFDNLKDKVKALGFDDQDIVFNQTNYNTLKLASDDRLWVWPIVAMHEERTSDKTRFVSGDDGLKYSRPMFNFNYLINSIITNQNWTFANDQELTDTICISANHEKFYVTSYQKELTDTFNLSGSENLTGLNSPDFNEGNILSSTTIETGSTKVKFRLRGNVTAANQVKIQIKGTESVTSKVTIQDFIIDSDQTVVDFTSKTFSSSANSITVEILIDGTGNFEFLDTLLYTIIEENDFGDLSTNPLLDYKVKAYDNLLSISQLDLFKLSAILTNSIYIPDRFNKHIQIKSLNALSKLNAVDWSSKFDQASEFIENRLTNYGQINELLYNNDDNIDASIGKDTFEVFNQSLKDVVEFLTVPFSATNDIEINTFSIADFDIYNDTERVNDLNPRILFFYDNDPTPVYTLGRFQELDWRNLKTNYYKDWFDSLNRTRVIEGFADLKKLDVLGFDFLQLVYIEYFKSYFFVLLIEDYIPGKKTKVKLLKFL